MARLSRPQKNPEPVRADSGVRPTTSFRPTPPRAISQSDEIIAMPSIPDHLRGSRCAYCHGTGVQQALVPGVGWTTRSCDRCTTPRLSRRSGIGTRETAAEHVRNGLALVRTVATSTTSEEVKAQLSAAGDRLTCALEEIEHGRLVVSACARDAQSLAAQLEEAA